MVRRCVTSEVTEDLTAEYRCDCVNQKFKNVWKDLEKCLSPFWTSIDCNALRCPSVHRRVRENEAVALTALYLKKATVV